MMPLRTGAALGFVVVGLIFSITLMCAINWGTSRNTLYENGNWVSSKPLMELAPMASVHFLLERQPLQRNRLNLHAWHGYNEVHLNRVFDPGAIHARFRLAAKGYVYVIFNRDQSGFHAIRLSRHPRLPSAFVEVNRQGSFLRKVELTDLDLAGGWHAIELNFSGGELVARLDDREIDVPSVAPTAQQFIGFRGSSDPSIVDDIRVTAADGSLVIHETFVNRDGRSEIAVRVFLGLAALAAVFVLVGLIGNAWRPAAFRLLATLFTLLIVVLGYYGFDAFVWSGQYAYYDGFTPQGHRGSSWLSDTERWRARVFGAYVEGGKKKEAARSMAGDPFIKRAITTWREGSRPSAKLVRYMNSQEQRALGFLRTDELLELPKKRDDDLRLAFVGTSQTFGEGVELEGDRFVDRIHRRIAALLGDGVALETFNFAVKGSRSDLLFERYQSVWVNTRPDVLAINLSYNDHNMLATSLRKFVELNRSVGIETVFITEPAAPETRMSWNELEKKRNEMRDLAAQLDVPLIDLSAYMESPAVIDSGLFWWDDVHMTSLGHRVAADFVADGLRPIVMSAM